MLSAVYVEKEHLLINTYKVKFSWRSGTIKSFVLNITVETRTEKVVEDCQQGRSQNDQRCHGNN